MKTGKLLQGVSFGVCPCCGNALSIGQDVQFRLESHALVSSTYAVVFSHNQSQIFNLLWKNRNNGNVVRRQSMLDELYSLDPNGGAEDKIIDVMISKMRKRIAATDLEIVTVFNQGFVLRPRKKAAVPENLAEVAA